MPDESNDDNIETFEYDVLFWKKKWGNSGKSAKNNAKLDGVLSVQPLTSKVVLRHSNSSIDGDAEVDTARRSSSEESGDEDNYEPCVKKKKGARLWQQRKQQQQKRMKSTANQKHSQAGSAVVVSIVQRDIAAQAETLSDDDEVVVGAYNVQIQNRRVASTHAVSNQNATQPFQEVSARKPITSKTSLLNRSKTTASVKHHHAQAIQHKTTVKSSSLVNGQRRTILSKRPPAQPQKSQSLKEPLPSMTTSAQSPHAASSSAFASAVKKRPQIAKSLRRPLSKPLSNISSTNAQKNTSDKSKPSTSPLASSAATNRDSTGAAVWTSKISVPNSLRTSLRPHQVTAIQFLYDALTTKGGAILADEMGLGKSAVTIAIICALHRQNRDKNFVIVCPSSLVNNWANEFEKWIGKASQPKRVVIQRGGEEGLQQLRSYFASMKQQQQTLQRFQKVGQVLLISYDLFRRNATQFVSSARLENGTTSAGLLVMDEGHKLKNKNGSLTLTALQSLPSDARLCLTATPIQNNLTEFYALANFVCPGVLGSSPSEFARDYERPISAANNRKGASAEERAYGLAQSRKLDRLAKTFVLRRLQKDVLKSMLPPRTEALLFCQPSTEQRRIYRSVADSSPSDALSALTSLRKICSHPVLLQPSDGKTDENNINLSLSGKLQVLETLLQSIRRFANEDKVVIVSNFTSVLTLIESAILKPRTFSFLRLDGTVKLADRQNIVDAFNRSSAERNFCLLLSSKAGGCGLNLVGGNRLIMVDADWNPASDIQAMARVYRQGQTKPCTIYRFFTAGTVEEVIYQRQSQKGGLAALTVDRKRTENSGANFTKEELADCFTLKEGCTCDTKRKIGSLWPDYTGPDNLENCTDVPLLHTAKALPQTLGHIHIIHPGEQRNDDNVIMDTFDGSSDDDDDEGTVEQKPAAENDSSEDEGEFEFTE